MSAYSDECALLMAMRMLLADSEAWTKHVLARDRRGRETEPESEMACKWCLLGAAFALRCAAGEDDLSVRPAMKMLVVPDGRFGSFNDRLTHAQMLAALDRAIEASL
jgi:hypothetical protein